MNFFKFFLTLGCSEEKIPWQLFFKSLKKIEFGLNKCLVPIFHG